MSHEVIVKSMIDAAMAGTSFQSAIRQFINDSISSCTHEFVAGRIAEICAAFKKESKEKETLIYNKEDQELFRKRVNNIINDVSRICRDLLGYTIVNKKRKGGEYAYAAVVCTPIPVPPAESPVALAGSMTVTACTKVHFDSEIHINKPNPNSITDFVKLFGGEDTAAHKAFMWMNWTPQEFVSKMDAAKVDLEEVAKLLLARLKGRGAA